MYIVYTQEFTHYLYIHLKYITVHRTLSDTTVQLYNTIAVLYAYYTFLGNNIQYTLD